MVATFGSVWAGLAVGNNLADHVAVLPGELTRQ